MKKILYLSFAALLALTVSCKKENNDTPDQPGGPDNPGDQPSSQYGVDGKTPLPEALDFGIQVNGKTIKWASFNLGASSPEESGDYYAWGETEAKSDYTWTTYTLASGNDHKLRAYCPSYMDDYWDMALEPGGPDRETKLLPKDDAVRTRLGGKWRMPTKEEFDALNVLKDNPDYTWEQWASVKDAGGNDVNGLRITQKSSGKVLFIPAAGYWNGKEKTPGSGHYWTSSLVTDTPNKAYEGIISSTAAGWGNMNRYRGHTIRPVWCDDPAQTVNSVKLQHNKLNLFTGTTHKSFVTVDPAGAALTWTSSNPSVATVDDKGEISAVGAGKALIMVTAGEKSDGCEVTVTARTNLSAAGTANCYIVTEPGIYCFDTKVGNSSEKISGVYSAEVLWETFGTATAPSKGDLLKIYSTPGEVVTFKTSDPLKNGNALIAVKNLDGTILWSWHIWICADYNPESKAQTYNNNAGVMMDRNLGAMSATAGEVGALGLMYQWGRKDPFLGSSSISSGTKAASTLSWPSSVHSDNDTGNMAYAVAHPTTFIESHGSTHYFDWMWDSTHKDEDRWYTSKTIYDPCPPGWKVPSSSVWSTAAGGESTFSFTWHNSGKGMGFSGKFGSASSIWYPASGCLLHSSGSLDAVGEYGFYWSCDPVDVNDAYALFIQASEANPHYSCPRANGVPVRCMKQ